MAALRIGTRGSALALAQAGAVAELIADRGASAELVEVTTYGDRSAAAITELGGTGVFVSALRDRLMAGDIHVAVHSLKDLPTAAADGLVVAAIPPREDARDVVVARDRLLLADLPPGSRVGTGSPRRVAQLRMLHPGLDVVAVRGNVDTRLAAVTDGALDAVVVARAGLARLGSLDAATEVLDVGRMLPAPGQGALAIECREDATSVRSLLEVLDDPGTRAVVTAERAVLAGLGAGCTAPVGAHAVLGSASDGAPVLLLDAVVAAFRGDGTVRSIRLSTTGPFSAAAELGRGLAAELLAAGAADLLGESP
jgi:hydroxymethylbilane synthase